MIQSFSDYLQARAVAFHEAERIQALEVSVWGNPRLGPVARDRSDATITAMKASLTMLADVIADYEAETITPTLRKRRAVRTLNSGADSGGEAPAEAWPPAVDGEGAVPG